MAWTRHGECNHCGWCCETLARQFVVRRPVEQHWVEFYKARGFAPVEVGLVGRFATLVAHCPQHVDDRCAMGDAKPARCKEWPTQPAEIVGTPCSYWFESTRVDVKVGGSGSPHACDEAALLAIERRAALL